MLLNICLNIFFQALQETGANMQAERNPVNDEIKGRLQSVSENLNHLRTMVRNWDHKLEETVVNQQCATSVEKEAWISETQHLTSWKQIWIMLTTVMVRDKLSAYKLLPV